MGRPVAQWIGGGAEPRILAGFETTVRLEKHRHKKSGERVRVSFRMTEAVPQECRGASATKPVNPSSVPVTPPAPLPRHSALDTPAETKAEVA